nr:MAG TPA: zinc-ribbon domain protein [Bacteriophage sp.]DAQ87942.1 MAG TPA: zinc-ribbon domain protein [Caudoviricetes sp.]
MLYCNICGSPLRYIGETKDASGNVISIYSCPKCNKLVYI